MARPDRVVLAIDQGTTSVRASVLDARLELVAFEGEAVARTYPKPGWVEIDANEILRATERVAAKALEKAKKTARDIAGVGFANQGETVVVWDRKTGEPIAPAIVWQCRRTEAICRSLRDSGIEDSVRDKTGLPIDPYFSATKIAWLLDEIPGARARAENGELVAGTLDTFTMHRLSRGRLFVTDPSTACRTLLASLDDGRFSRALSDTFRVPHSMLAEVVASDADLGPIEIAGGTATLRAMLCDQPSALLGTGCLAPGDAKCTYGTGAFLQINTGSEARVEPDGLLRSIAWELGSDRSRAYLIEGGVLAAGDVLTWLCEGLGMLARPEEVDHVLATTPDSAGVLFAPALTGLGAPRWAGDARGTMIGIHRGVRREHVIRAALEGVAHQVADILDVASRAVPRLSPIWADGGLSSSLEFLKMQANLTGSTLRRAGRVDATTRGVAAIAAVSAGLAPSLESILAAEPTAIVAPSIDADARARARLKNRRLLDVVTSRVVMDLAVESP